MNDYELWARKKALELQSEALQHPVEAMGEELLLDARALATNAMQATTSRSWMRDAREHALQRCDRYVGHRDEESFERRVYDLACALVRLTDVGDED